MKQNTAKHPFVRRGRLISVDGMMWRYKVGKGGNVIAYSEHGERLCSGAWTIKGIDPETFDRGQYKKSFDGMVTPHEVVNWIRERLK